MGAKKVKHTITTTAIGTMAAMNPNPPPPPPGTNENPNAEKNASEIEIALPAAVLPMMK
jgi:hypothetical protein